jgi:hypothetical protein
MAPLPINTDLVFSPQGTPDLELDMSTPGPQESVMSSTVTYSK